MMTMKKTVFELLELRTEFEELASSFKLSSKHGNLDGLRAFLDNGHKANRFRPGYDRAVELAKTILAEFPNATSKSAS